MSEDDLRQIMDERDKRYEQRFLAQERAVEAALTSAKEAVLKAEASADKRFDSVNEFRGALSDAQATLLTRNEYNIEHRALVEKVEELTAGMTSIMAATTAVREMKTWILALASLVVVVAGVAISNFVAR